MPLINGYIVGTERFTQLTIPLDSIYLGHDLIGSDSNQMSILLLRIDMVHHFVS